MQPLVPLLAATILLCSATILPAQSFPFSQRGSVMQNVAHTELAISYGRPIARGRALFGQLVPWDSVWHPGADSATRLIVSREITVEGKPLAAGEYSLWIIPRQSANWTLIFSSAARVFHKPYPGEANDVLRVDVAAETGAHMETMAFYFPLVLRDDAILRLHWGTTVLPIRIKAPYRP
jgi:hypothetical protein